MGSPLENTRALINNIVSLTRSLPTSVPLATDEDRIFAVMNSPEGESTWHTFNKRFDALFGEDCHDSTGQLHHIHRGRLGMDKVCNYLSTLDVGSVPLDLATIKLVRLRDGLVQYRTSAKEISGTPPTATVSNKTKPVPHSDTGKRVRTLTTKAAARPNYLQDESNDDNSDALPPTKENEMHAKGRNGNLKPKNKRKKKEKTHPLKQFYEGSTPLATDEPEHKDKTYKLRERRAMSIESTGSVRLDKEGHEIISDASPIKATGKRKRTTVEEDFEEYELSSSESSDSSLAVIDNTKKLEAKNKGARTSQGKYKRPQAGRNTRRRERKNAASASGDESDHISNISTEYVSDGDTALKNVRKNEATRGQQARRGPKSETRSHWHDPIMVVEPGKKPKRWQFKCKYCPILRTLPRSEGCDNFDDENPQPPIGNLSTHTKVHAEKIKAAEKQPASASTTTTPPDHGYTRASAKVMENMLLEGKLNPKIESTQKGFLKVFAAWLLEEDLPFTTGEAPGLKRLFHYLDIKYQLPSDTTVRNQLAHIFASLHSTVVEELSSVKSKISYSHDSWTTSQMVFSFAGTIAHFIDDDWNLVERLVDFHHMGDKEHAGAYAAKAFVKSAAGRGGLKKISPIIMDNASNCDVLARVLGILLMERYGMEFHSDNARIRCLAHVVNIVVQTLLKQLNEAEDPEILDWFEGNRHLPVHYDGDEDEEVKAMEAEDLVAAEDGRTEIDEILEDELPKDASSLSVVKKLRVIVNKIVSSPQRRQHFKRCAKKQYDGVVTAKGSKLELLMVIRDVVTRWNYTHAMIKRALMLHKAVDQWVFENEKLRRLLLTPEQWILLEQLCSILEVFTAVTFEMSKSGAPTLPWALPCYHRMQCSLRANVENDKLPLDLRGAAAAGLARLDYYYAMARANHYNILATVLHPTLRLKFFKKLGSAEYDRAETIFKHVYQQYEMDYAPAAPTTTSMTPTWASDSSFLSELAMLDDNEDTYIQEHEKSEYERYAILMQGGSGKADDPLKWWKDHERDFPIISRMARDFLAIPGASVSVERLFSKSRHLCTDLRGSLKAETVTEAMCARQWLREGLFKLN